MLLRLLAYGHGVARHGNREESITPFTWVRITTPMQRCLAGGWRWKSAAQDSMNQALASVDEIKVH